MSDYTLAEPEDADEAHDESKTSSNGDKGEKTDTPYNDADCALVKEWIKRVKDSKNHNKKAFKQMEDNEYLATHGADRAWRAGKNYTVAIVNRHINQAVAALYARDPVAQAKPRKKMRFTVWDGRQDTLQSALQMLGAPPLPENEAAIQQANAIVKDILQARQQEQLVTKTGKTLEILWEYFTSQQDTGFKDQMKALVRRTKVDGVGYIKLAFQRVLEPRPEVAARIEDATSEIARTELLLEREKDDDWDKDSARASELKSLLEQLKDREYMVVREGPVFDFPKATRVIIDRHCTHLKTLTGAGWIAQEFDMTDDEIFSTYDVDIKNVTAVTAEGSKDPGPVEGEADSYDAQGKPKAEIVKKRLVWEVQDKRNSQFVTICEGYDQFLSPPGEPDVKIARFFTIFPLVFNEIESETELYPPSDVELLVDTQNEYNRSRQGLREHRQANRPKYAAAKGSLSAEDKEKLGSHPANAVIEFASLKPGDKIENVVQRMQMVAIDPAQYATQEFFSDIERIVGTQQANLGTGSNTTATETSIVEAGRQAGIGDNLDDLDGILSKLALSTSELMLLELSTDIVQKIVGAGAVWPEAPPSRQDLSENVYLDIKAGSTGRPNRAVDLANIERAFPVLLQVPGFNMASIRDKVSLLLDIDPEEAVADGMPSITAINAMLVKSAPQAPGAGAGPSAGPPPPQAAAHGGPPPAMQGHAGGQNAPMVQGQAGPQPGMTPQTPPH